MENTQVAVDWMPRLQAAWDHLARRPSAPGVDGVTVEQFAASASTRLESLADALASGRWRPQPARRVRLDNDAGRELSIPTVEDRIVQRAVAGRLTPYAENALTDAACAYRRGRGVKGALEHVAKEMDAGARWFARTDVARFFDSIPRDALVSTLRDHGVPGELIGWVERLITAGVVEGAVTFDPALGVPQGSALSPVLSNLYLAAVDRRMLDGGYVYLRYADDILILTRTEASARDGLTLLSAELGRRGLALGARKTAIGHVGAGLSFLGARFDLQGQCLSRRAHELLVTKADDAARSPDGVSRLVELVAAWERWYGPLRPADVTTVPILAGVVGQGRDGAELAATRLGLTAQRSTHASMHVELALRWRAATRSPDAISAQAAVVDARLAVLRKPTEDEARRLGMGLGLQPSAIPNLREPPDRLPAVFAAQGALILADAARRLVSEPPAVAAPAQRPTVDPAILLQVFRGADQTHAVSWRDPRGQSRFRAVERPLQLDAVSEHVSGGPRRAIHVRRTDDTVLVSALEVRLRREALLGDGGVPLAQRARALSAAAQAHASSLAAAASELGANPVIERETGRCWRVWLLFEDPVALGLAHRYLNLIIARAPAPPACAGVVQIPGTDRVRRPPGPCLPLPFGKTSGTWSRLYGADGVPLEPALLSEQQTPADVVCRVLEVPHAKRSQDARHRDPYERLRKGQPRAAAVIRGCAMLRHLAAKAAEIGHLEAMERASMFESIGHLPGGGAASLNVLLGHAGVSAGDVRRRLKKLHAHPISCAKIRERHRSLAQEVGCDCPFGTLPKGAWPTPVLHTATPEEIPAMRPRRRRPRRNHRRPTATPTKPTTATPASRTPTSSPTSAESAPDTPCRDFPQAVRTLGERKRALTQAQSAYLAARDALENLFREAGVDRVEIPDGWLVRIPGKPVRYVIEREL